MNVQPQRKRRLTPAQLLVLGFAVLIFLGGLLLNLPCASQSGESIGFLNALFTATSASCVTGQIVVNTAGHWTWFGKTVILLLIQAGGLGVMTLVTFTLMLLHRQITIRERLVIQTTFGQDAPGGMVRLLRRVLLVTLVAEGIGAVILTLGFYTSSAVERTFLESIEQGVFHAISGFCNAGFDIVGPDGMMPYVENPLISITLMLLIVSGGLGYPVWIELAQRLRAKNRKPLSLPTVIRRLSVHSKMVISITLALIIGGACLFMLLEWRNPETLGALSAPGKVLAAFFQSVTLRTAGFNTVDQAGLGETSQFLSVLLMFVGGSPAGTAGGVKTVSLGVVLFSMVSVLRGRNRIEAFKRQLSLETLQKALTVISLLGIVLLGSTLALCFTEQNNPFDPSFLDLLFECASVSGTVGVTTGVTPYLSSAGKVVGILAMFIGRLGPVTVAMAMSLRLRRSENVPCDINYPQGNVLIG